MADTERTSVEIGPREHEGLLRVRAAMELDTGRRLALRDVVAELLRAWWTRRGAGQDHVRS